MNADDLAKYRAQLAHRLDVATGNHRAADAAAARDWEAGRIDAYRDALELLDDLTRE